MTDALGLAVETRLRIKTAAKSLAILLAIFAAFHVVELTAFQISIDDEFAISRDQPDVWIEQGRFTVYLVERFLLPHPVVPFLPHALFGLCIALAYIVLFGALGTRELGPVHFAVFPLFAAFPTWLFLLEFASNTPSEGLGVLAACCALAVFARCFLPTRERPGIVSWLARLGAAGALGAIALGAYQANLLLLVTAGLGLILVEVVTRDAKPAAIVRGTFVLGLLAAASLGLYSVVLGGFRSVLEVDPEYVGKFLQLDDIVSDPLKTALATLREGFEIYCGDPTIYGTRAFGFGCVALLGFAAIAFAPALRGRPAVRVLAVVLALALLAAPLGLSFASRGHIAYRTHVAVPVMMSIFALVGLTVGGRWLARATAVALLLSMWHMQYSASLFQAGGALVRQHDFALATAIHDRIETVHPNFSRTATHKVEFYGGIEFSTTFPQMEGSTRARSFFEWAGGRPDRIIDYMRTIGFDHLREVSDQERRALTPVLAGMPIWPADGCVRAQGDVILVRLGENPGLLHRGSKGKRPARTGAALPADGESFLRMRAKRARNKKEREQR